MINVYMLMSPPEMTVYPEPVHAFVCKDEDLEDLLKQYVEENDLTEEWEVDEMDFNDIPIFVDGCINGRPKNPWDWYFVQSDYSSNVI